jgi:molybdate/tungstate transport system substrate-binding protein
VNKIIKTVLIFLSIGFLAAAVMTNEKPSEVSGQLIIFHAGSLAVPFKQICDEFKRFHPKVEIVREAAGSRLCARKITDLHRPCDVIASADYTVIDALLIPEYADWNIRFATNEIVIAFREDTHRAAKISKDNWHDILLDKRVAFGRSDPDADPCGYRAVLTIMLAERFYNRHGLAGKMLAKDQRYIRPKEVDLLALLEVGELDYIFTYRSIAEQHGLEYLMLPDEINLKKAGFADLYKSASIRLTGKKPGTFITKTGTPIVYGVTIPRDAPNRELALAFLAFLLDADKGGAILERNGQASIVPAPTDTFDKLPEALRVFAVPKER